MQYYAVSIDTHTHTTVQHTDVYVQDRHYYTSLQATMYMFGMTLLALWSLLENYAAACRLRCTVGVLRTVCAKP